MSLSQQNIERLVSGIEDPEWEPGLDTYREHLRALNDIVIAATGGRGEGNLFYPDFIDPIDRPHPRYLGKRRNFALFAAAGGSMLEIGVNAGHSLILALSINPGLRYTGVDWCGHPYSKPCFEYLRASFGDRVELIEGDSRKVLPYLVRTRRHNFDLFHIDGGHGFEFAHADLINTLDLSRDGDLILFDDTDILQLEALCDYYVISGRLGRVAMGRIWQAGSQTLLRVQQRA
jgi:Methyltransferase domain